MRPLVELQIKRFRGKDTALDANNLALFEQCFAIRVPGVLARLLNEVNGGLLKACAFKHAGRVGEMNALFGLYSRSADDAAMAANPRSWDFRNLWGEKRITSGVLDDADLPIGQDNGGSRYFVNTQLGDQSPVFELGGSTRKICKIADSLEELIDSLYAPAD